MFQSWLGKCCTLRGQDVLSIGWDLGRVNLLDVVHINLVVVVVLRNEWRYSLFRFLLRRRESGEVISRVVRLQLAAFVRFCYVAAQRRTTSARRASGICFGLSMPGLPPVSDEPIDGQWPRTT
jgi:hypothetical protein